LFVRLEGLFEIVTLCTSVIEDGESRLGRFRSNPSQMIRGIHEGFIVLGALTVLSTIVFRGLHANDGNTISKAKVLPG
jgi:hypothetical protein